MNFQDILVRIIYQNSEFSVGNDLLDDVLYSHGNSNADFSKIISNFRSDKKGNKKSA